MGRQNHKVQHRTGHDSKQVELKNALQELRSQNQKLRRENARLRRENEELYSRESVTDPVEAPLAEVESGKPAPSSGCPNGCEGPLKSLDLGSKRLKVCQKCLWRTSEVITG